MPNSDGKMDWDQVVSGSGAPSQTSSRDGGGRGRGGAPSGRTRSAGRRRKGRVGRRIGLGIVFTVLGGLIAGLAAFLILYARLDVPAADQVALSQTTTVYYADGTTEMGTFSEINRTIIDPSTLPDYVGQAVVASEDRTFYTNAGIDLKGILRALVNNVRGGERQGGSTLTQQYVERYYVGETTSYTGKVKEAVLAVKINREQSKDEILGNYINTIYFGRGAYGIEAASKAYFGHPAADMSVSEAAMLAGIIPAPSAWDPALDPDKAQERWQRVLDLMVEDGHISQADADAATFPDTIPPSEGNTSMTGTTGYLMQQVRTELEATGTFTDEQIDTGGLSIISTIDKTKQDAAVAAASSMTEVEGWNGDTMHTALSSVDPATGEIVAEYAGADYQKRQQNAVTDDIAQAGSTFKTFALLAHAEKGGSIMDTYDGSSPERFDGLTDPVQNDGNYSFGRVTLKKAAEYSINTAFVSLNEQVGPATTMEAAIQAGIPQDTNGLEPTLLNVLGFAAPHNIDITRAYATIASGGMKVDPHIVREVKDASGATAYATPVDPQRVFQAADVSAIMPGLKAAMGADGTGEKAAALGRIVAGKTGTSEDQRSAQFVAMVPQLVTAVSMYQSDAEGNSVRLDDIGGLDQFHGGDWPADVWVKYMSVAVQDLPDEDFSWITQDSTRAPSVAPAPTWTQAPEPEPPQPQPQAPEPEESPQQPPTPTPTPEPPTPTPEPTETGQSGD
ncbi:MAG: penicillin-binding protein [Actinomyces sp.]|nr:penicillin-binding protein [Actinomyces sp.]